MIVISISGTPGVGKTSIAKPLAEKLDYVYMDMEILIAQQQLKHTYSKTDKAKVVDAKEMSKAFTKEKAKLKRKGARGIIFDSHMSQFIKADLYIVLECSDLKELKRRLQKRKYSAKKIRDNLDSEIFKVCRSDVIERKKEPVVFDTALLTEKQLLRKALVRVRRIKKQ